MATLVEADNLSEESVEYQCSICETKGNIKSADHYCFDCQRYLCGNCLSGHNTYIANHTVLAVTDDNFQNILTERCEKHPNELIQYYCRNHDAVLCNACERTDHRKCEDVKHMNDTAEELSANQEIQAVPDQLQAVLQKVNHAIEHLDAHADNVKKKGQAYLTDLDDYEQNLIAKVKELKAKAINSIAQAQQQIISKANESRKELIESKERISTCIENVKRSEKRKAHLIIIKKKGQIIVNIAETLCRVSENKIKDNVFCFRPEYNIDESLGKFTSLVTTREKYTLRQISEIDLESSIVATSCDIYGCGGLGDGTLVLSDWQKKRLKRVDPSNNKVTDHYDMSKGQCGLFNRPSGICSIGPQEVAVAVGSNIVHIISAVKGLTPSRTVDMGQNTSILACHGGELFAGCGASLRIHDMSGTMIRDISRHTDGQSIFYIITGIAVNEAGDRVFVSDCDNGLVCTSRDGRVVFRLSNNDMGLDEAWGVTTDRRGMVMVAGRWSSHNVVQVTDEGRVVGEILAKKDGMRAPKCLFYDNDGRKLYIGGWMSQLLGFELL